MNAKEGNGKGQGSENKGQTPGNKERASGEKEKNLSSGEKPRSEKRSGDNASRPARACGKQETLELFEKASGGTRANENSSRQDYSQGLTIGKAKGPSAIGEDPKSGRPLISDEGPNPAERATSWLMGEDLDVEFDVEFLLGAQAMFDRYQEMKKRNLLNHDDFFHCVANCESAAKGSGGVAASVIIGGLREVWDLGKNLSTTNRHLGRPMTWKESREDMRNDLQMNRMKRESGYSGRNTGSSGLRCERACESVRPTRRDLKILRP